MEEEKTSFFHKWSKSSWIEKKKDLIKNGVIVFSRIYSKKNTNRKISHNQKSK